MMKVLEALDIARQLVKENVIQGFVQQEKGLA